VTGEQTLLAEPLLQDTLEPLPVAGPEVRLRHVGLRDAAFEGVADRLADVLLAEPLAELLDVRLGLATAHRLDGWRRLVELLLDRLIEALAVGQNLDVRPTDGLAAEGHVRPPSR
jgi:hypothetical protein